VQFSTAATASFTADQRYIEAIINDANREARRQRSSLNWDVVTGAIAVYLAGPSLASWQQQMTGAVSSLMTDRVNDLNRQFKQTYPAADLLAQEWFNEYTINFAQYINATTEETIRRLIEQGVSEGWSVPMTMKHLETLFNQWMTGNVTPAEFEWFNQRLPEYRLETIARTETMKALNAVSYRLYSAWGVEFHEWLATHDNRTRQDHRAIDGQVVRVGSPFSVGGWPMLYPHDPAGPPEETINCRCSTSPRT
jgi:SPP1 gp7 family putative phage head morphogenesis protein